MKFAILGDSHLFQGFVRNYDSLSDFTRILQEIKEDSQLHIGALLPNRQSLHLSCEKISKIWTRGNGRCRIKSAFSIISKGSIRKLYSPSLFDKFTQAFINIPIIVIPDLPFNNYIIRIADKTKMHLLKMER